MKFLLCGFTRQKSLFDDSGEGLEEVEEKVVEEGF